MHGDAGNDWRKPYGDKFLPQLSKQRNFPLFSAYKKLSGRRETARRAVPVEIFVNYGKICTTVQQQIEVIELEGYS